MTTSQGRLLAILANPSTSPSTRTEQRVRLAASLLGYERCEVANLFQEPSVTSRDIQQLGAGAHGWLAAREAIAQALPRADGVLLAPGLLRLSGAPRLHLAEQREWLREHLIDASHHQVWQVGDARHPSRWHQYLCDAHGRTNGGTFDERLRESLKRVDITAAWGQPTPPLSRPRIDVP